MKKKLLLLMICVSFTVVSFKSVPLLVNAEEVNSKVTGTLLSETDESSTNGITGSTVSKIEDDKTYQTEKVGSNLPQTGESFSSFLIIIGCILLVVCIMSYLLIYFKKKERNNDDF